MSGEIETSVNPPMADDDGDGGDQSARLMVSLIEVNDVSYDAAVQFFGDNATDPAAFADALLNVSIAVASMRGSDYAWAVMQRLAAYDGGAR